MKYKIQIALMAAGCLMAAMFLPIRAQAGEPKAAAPDATVIQTTVPDQHSVRLDISGRGSVEVDGKKYTASQTIQIDRLEEAQYKLIPEKGYKIESVLYNQSHVTDQLKDGVYTAGAINEDDMALTVTFTKKSSVTPQTGSEKSNKSTSGKRGTQAAKTGDETHLVMLAVMLVLSASLIGYSKKRKTS